MLASAVPAAIAGVVLEDALLDLGENVTMIAVLLIVFGILLLLADRLPTARGEQGREVEEFIREHHAEMLND